MTDIFIMAALIDLTGQVFGRLVVVMRDPTKNRVYWICRCSCGNEICVRASHLSDGTTKSCGCLLLDKANDLSGQRFGRLTAESRAENMGEGRSAKARWNCRCECGNVTVVFAHALKSGNTTSCGCLKQETCVTNGKLKRRHGMTKSRTWVSWDSMLQRCENRKHKSYKNYGGRGITICDRWHTFENFHADMGDAPEGLSIERNDVNGNYEPSNCRWATMLEQGANKRNNTLITANGETKPLSAWCRQYGISKVTLMDRIKRGWSPERAITTPPRAYIKASAA
jgi:hypothetical protein